MDQGTRAAVVVGILIAVLLAWPGTARADGVTLLAAASGQKASGGTGLWTDLELRWRLGEVLGLAVTGRSGGLRAPGSTEVLADDDELLLALAVGPVAIWPLGRHQAHAAVQVAHVHHATVGGWRNRPLASLAGDSSGAVVHRTGLEGAVGVTWPALRRGERWAVVLDTDLTAGLLPTSPALAWHLGVRVGLGLQSLP